MTIDQSRLDQRIAGVIKSAILSRSLSDEMMLERGIAFIAFCRNFHDNVKVKD